MSTKKRGLGKGLNELLSATLGSNFVVNQPLKKASEADNNQEVTDQVLRSIGLEKLAPGPFQPRQTIRHEGLEQLAESMKAQGVLQPIVVRQKGDNYEIIAGERRFRAAKLAGLTEIPAIIRQVSDKAALAMALIENIQRENLNPLEEAFALKRLAEDLQLTHLQVAEAVGKSRVSVTNLLRLLTLNADVQTMLEQEQIEMGHARALLGVKGPLQSQLAHNVVTRKLSVRETEAMVSKLQEEESKPLMPQKFTADPNIRRLEEDLADKLGANVAIRHGQRGGMVVIRYHNVDELEGILAHIK